MTNLISVKLRADSLTFKDTAEFIVISRYNLDYLFDVNEAYPNVHYTMF